jgi:hypothetical protein
MSLHPQGSQQPLISAVSARKRCCAPPAALPKVKDAVIVKYRGGTFNRVETDSGSVYETHIATSAGDNLTVELDKDYAITGSE